MALKLGDTTQGEAAAVAAEKTKVETSAEEARKSWKELLEDKHVADGPSHNLVLSILSFVQIYDSCLAFQESSGLLQIKAAADTAIASLQIASTLPAAYVRLFGGKRIAVALMDTGRIVGARGIPLLSIASGAMQVYGGLHEENGIAYGDVVGGGLNVISGAALAIYGFGLEVEVAPVVGQIAGTLAFMVGTAVVINDASKPMTERYIVGALESLVHKRWDYDAPNTLVSVLKVADAVEQAAASARLVSFQRIPSLHGERKDLLNSLAFYVGVEAADEMIGAE